MLRTIAARSNDVAGVSTLNDPNPAMSSPSSPPAVASSADFLRPWRLHWTRSIGAVDQPSAYSESLMPFEFSVAPCNGVGVWELWGQQRGERYSTVCSGPGW